MSALVFLLSSLYQPSRREASTTGLRKKTLSVSLSVDCPSVVCCPCGQSLRASGASNISLIRPFLLLKQTAVQSSILFLSRTVDRISQTSLVRVVSALDMVASYGRALA